MPVNLFKQAKSVWKHEKADHVYVRAPLSKRDLTSLHKHNEQQVLTLHRIHSDSFELIADWADLRSLILYGCKIVDWSPLARCKRLEHLFINTVRARAPDLSVLSQLRQLRDLSIGYVRHLTTLPDMSRCTRLRRLSIFNCKRLEDLSPILKITNLESFHIVVTPQQPTDLEAIMAMPKMKYMTGSFANRKKNELFRELLGKYGLVYGD